MSPCYFQNMDLLCRPQVYAPQLVKNCSAANQRLMPHTQSHSNIFSACAPVTAAIDDMEQQWRLAIDFTQFVGQMLQEATDYAGKLVNGSAGEWCPDTAEEVEGMWAGLLVQDTKVPPKEMIKEALDAADFAGTTLVSKLWKRR